MIGTDPWDGTCFGCAGEDSRAATGYVAGVPYSVELGPDSTALSRDGVPLLSAGVRGRFRNLETGESSLSVGLPAAAAGFIVELAVAGPGPAAGPGPVVTLDGTRAPDSRIGPVRRAAGGVDWLPVRVPGSPRPRRLEVARRPAG